jgi:hypothetical protein
MPQATSEMLTAWRAIACLGSGGLNAMPERGNPRRGSGHIWRQIRPIFQVPRRVPRQVPEGRVAHVPA